LPAVHTRKSGNLLELASGSLLAVNTPNQGDLIADRFGAETSFATNGGKVGWLRSDPSADLVRVGQVGLSRRPVC